MRKYTKNEEWYLKHKIMKQTTKAQIKDYFQIDDSDEIKPTIIAFLAKRLKLEREKLDDLDKEYKIYFEKLYTKMEDSFKSKYRLFIFNVYLKHKKLLEIEDIDFNEFAGFTITDKLIEDFAATYYQEDEKHKDPLKPCENSITKFCSNKNIKENPLKDIYKKLKYDYISNAIENNFTLEQWKSMYRKTSCAYCGVTNEQIDALRNKKKITSKSGRGFNLEVDRMLPNLEYSYDNCCMSCYWCNNAKTDEFLPNEFKEIAIGINKAWNNRMKESQINDTVIFPEDSNVWDKK